MVTREIHHKVSCRYLRVRCMEQIAEDKLVILGGSLWSCDNWYYLMLTSHNSMIIVVIGFSRTLPNLLLLWVLLTPTCCNCVHRCQT